MDNFDNFQNDYDNADGDYFEALHADEYESQIEDEEEEE